MSADQEIADIKDEHFARIKGSRNVWIIEEAGADFVVQHWTPDGVAPSTTYPTLRKAAARLLQLLHVGPVAAQTWPEEICIGTVNVDRAES